MVKAPAETDGDGFQAVAKDTPKDGDSEVISVNPRDDHDDGADKYVSSLVFMLAVLQRRTCRSRLIFHVCSLCSLVYSPLPFRNSFCLCRVFDLRASPIR